ncbi:methyltransferase domain-containing protein, partial [Eubacteriales bacterium OttesenSCG-928-M02]|nr:methyltransferase domain-containing protein [Eubacteriales bacterium OttesenSCG-928-M02]
LCGAGFCMEKNSLKCERGHTYDISKKGTVNFLPNQRKTIYDASQFSARQLIFLQGYFDALVDCLARLVTAYGPKAEDGFLVDAGCGEGFFLNALQAKMPRYHYAGVDLEKAAIRLAARGGASIPFWVADLASLPLAEGVVDVLLNILSPANYQEFLRVLHPHGLVLKVLPGAHYLEEIRQMILPENAAYDNHETKELFYSHLKVVKEHTLEYTLPVPKELREAFFTMTPLTQRRVYGEAEFHRLDSITIHLDVLVGKAP